MDIFCLAIFCFFVFATIKFYFSDQNKNFTNKSRTFYSVGFKNDIDNLPLLENNTDNFFEYTNDLKITNKKKKYYKFFDLIKN